MPNCEVCNAPIKWIARDGKVIRVNMVGGDIHKCPPSPEAQPQTPAKAPLTSAAPEPSKPSASAQEPQPAGERQPEVVRHLEDTRGQYQDSIEIGTLGKGVIRVHHSLDDPEGFEKKIREAMRLRQVARDLQDQKVPA